MLKDDILKIITLIHRSGSAVSEKILYELLPKKIEKSFFLSELIHMETSGEIERMDNLILKEIKFHHRRNRDISRTIFRSEKKFLKIFSILPWIRFISLTGSNAFESCHEQDDLDMFVVTASGRLWLTYLLLVILSKLLNKRPFYCFNYLIDEDNLRFSQHSYHNAVQVFMMKPLFNASYKKEIYQQNSWISDYLPNMKYRYEVDDFYRVRKDFKRRRPFIKLFDMLNNYIFNKYRTRLTRKYPAAINRGILLSKGVAKLHQNDKSHMYDEIMNYNI